MKGLASFLLKFGVTVAIFVGIFLEFGGSYVPVDAGTLRAPGTFEVSNPAAPGIVGRLRARLQGAELPPPRIPDDADRVCIDASERSVFVRTTDGIIVRFKPIRHCGDGGLTTVYRHEGDGYVAIPAAGATGTVWFRKQGFQLVPAEFSELWGEIRNLDFSVFLPWFFAAMLVKLVGIF
jgi:hypothetical protein